MLPPCYPYLDAAGNLGIRAGDDWTQTLTVYTDDACAVPYNFTSHTALLQVTSKTGTVLFTASTAAGSITLGGALGTIAISVDKAVTALLTPGIYTYGLKLTDAGGAEVTWLAGAFEIAKQLVAAT